MTDAADVLIHLGQHAAKQFFIGIIHRAGKHEVKEHHQAKLVTNIEEPIVGIITAAPHANGVEIARLALLQQCACALWGDAAENIILGNVIRALGKHGHAVDSVIKADAICIGLAHQLHLSQTDAQLAVVYDFTVCHQPCLHGIERLLAKTVRPPKLRILHLCLFSDRQRGHAAIGCGQPKFGRSVPCKFHARRQEHSAALVPLGHTRIGNVPTAIVLQQIHAAPDARIGQSGTPVPAHHAMRLSQMGVAYHTVGRAKQMRFGILLADIARGRMADHAQLVVLAHELRHVKLIAQVHVIGVGYVRTVEVNAAQRVQSLEHQGRAISLIPPIKRARKRIVVFGYRQIQFLVVRYVRIGQYRVIHVQKRIDRAGNFALYGISATRHAPCAAKIKLSHGSVVLLASRN